MIPSVKTWIVRLVETGERIEMLAPTKTLARIGFRLDFPCHWGKAIKISLKKA